MFDCCGNQQLPSSIWDETSEKGKIVFLLQDKLMAMHTTNNHSQISYSPLLPSNSHKRKYTH